MSRLSTDSPQTTARLAGALWLIVIAVSIASVIGAPSIELRGSPAETAASVLAAETPYRLAFAALFAGGLCYLGVTALLYLILRSSLVPRIIGGVLAAGGSSYIISSFATFVAPAVGARMSPLVIPIAILGEGSLTLWLLFKGVNPRALQRA